jgi:hypothetical protein
VPLHKLLVLALVSITVNHLIHPTSLLILWWVMNVGEDGMSPMVASGSSMMPSLPPATSFDPTSPDGVIEAREALATKYFKKQLAVTTPVISFISLHVMSEPGMVAMTDRYQSYLISFSTC